MKKIKVKIKANDLRRKLNIQDGKNGKDGKTPTKQELLNLIKPLIPKDGYTPVKGVDYFDGLTPSIEDIVSKIPVPTLSELENNIPQLGEKIRDSLELLTGDDRLDSSAIKGLEKYKVGGGSTARNLYQLMDISLTSVAQGDILYHDGTRWVNLAHGTSGQFLKTQGAGANPVWATVSATTAWGGITGTLSDQTDLQTALNAKAPTDAPTFTTSITGSYLTASQLLATDASKNIVSLSTVTYPSLTELSYVKGVTSAIQTQLDGKATTALDNLGSVAINTSLISDTDITDDLGSSLIKWNNLFVKTIGATGTRVTKIWTTDLEITNLPSVNGTALTTTIAKLNLLTNAGGTTGTTSTNIVFSTSPVLTTPTLGVASATSINKVAITAPATSATLTIADTKTLTVNNTLTFAGTDSTTMTFPSTSATIARTDAANTFTGASTASAWVLTSPTITTKISPTSDDGAPLGDTTHNFSDLFLATGAVINYANSNVVLTHSSGILTLGTGDLRITTAGTNAASVVTVGGTQTLTAKTLTAPVFAASSSVLASTLVNGICEGRLTLTSGTPLTTSDVTGAGTIYFTPYKGNRIAIYDGSVWKLYTFSELSLALTATSDKNYDVWVYDNSGTLTLETTIWTDDTTRATNIVLQDGVYVKSGATTRRYLGSFRASASNATQDTKANRWLFNMYNRLERNFLITDSTNSWTYNTGTWRAWDNSSSNRFTVLIGVNDVLVNVVFNEIVTGGTSGGNPAIGIGVDSTSSNTADLNIFGAGNSIYTFFIQAQLKSYPGVGYHYFQALEYFDPGGGDSGTFYGDGGRAYGVVCGMVGNAIL